LAEVKVCSAICVEWIAKSQEAPVMKAESNLDLT
jgi:hypothetical protein